MFRIDRWQWVMRFGFFALFVMMLLYAAVVMWTDRNLDMVLTAFKEAPVDVPIWLVAIMVFVFGELMVVFDIVVEILKLLST